MQPKQHGHKDKEETAPLGLDHFSAPLFREKNAFVTPLHKNAATKDRIVSATGITNIPPFHSPLGKKAIGDRKGDLQFRNALSTCW